MLLSRSVRRPSVQAHVQLQTTSAHLQFEFSCACTSQKPLVSLESRFRLTTIMNQQTRSTKTSSSSASEDSSWLQTRRKHELDSPSLPLDWTRVKRRVVSPKHSVDQDQDTCCPLTFSVGLNEQLVQGLGVFCLHQKDPRWFQGYFFNDECNGKPWGILAVQEELDDCMWSSDGGYRRCSLTVFPYPARRKILINGVEWTGGDMIRLSNDKVNLQPERMLTGRQAVPHVEKIFGGLLEKFRKHSADKDLSSVLDVLPDVVVVSGPMKFALPRKINHVAA